MMARSEIGRGDADAVTELAAFIKNPETKKLESLVAGMLERLDAKMERLISEKAAADAALGKREAELHQREAALVEREVAVKAEATRIAAAQLAIEQRSADLSNRLHGLT